MGKKKDAIAKIHEKIGKITSGGDPNKIVIGSWDEFELRFAEYGKSKALLEEAAAVRDTAIQDAKNAYAEQISAPSTLVERLTEGLEAFLVAHKDEFASKEEGGSQRFRELLTGRVGFRKTSGALELLPGQTWDDVLARLQQHRRKFKAFIAISESVNKKRLLDAGETVWKALGIVFRQHDQPFLDTKAKADGVKPVASRSAERVGA